MDNPLLTTLSDAISFLERHHIPYALIGGLAASLRGEPRVTADVDLVIQATVEIATDLIDDLENTPFEPLFPGVDEVVRQAFILPIRHRNTRVKVDLSIGLSGFEQRLIGRVSEIDISGQKVCLATAEDILVMKVFAGRPRDQQDAEGIAMVQCGELDWDYCLETAAELGKAVDQDLTSQIEKLRKGFGTSD